jgi:hypothetical protein
LKAKSFQELQQIQQHLVEQQKLAAAREAARQEAQRKAHAEKTLFVRAAGAVKPLREQQRVLLAPEQPAPIPFQQQLDEQRVLREAISDEFDASTLLDVDDALSFRRPGIGMDVTRKLRKGHWSIQRELDRRSRKAFAACAWSTARAWARPARCRCSRARCRAG